MCRLTLALDLGSLVLTYWICKIHKSFAHDKSQDKTEADIERITDGPDSRGQHLGSHHPDQGSVSSIAKEEKDEDGHWRKPSMLELFIGFSLQVQPMIVFDNIETSAQYDIANEHSNHGSDENQLSAKSKDKE